MTSARIAESFSAASLASLLFDVSSAAASGCASSHATRGSFGAFSAALGGPSWPSAGTPAFTIALNGDSRTDPTNPTSFTPRVRTAGPTPVLW